jgi:hypothetical protein
MDQENSFIEENTENNLNDERLKKLFVILIAVSVLSGTYYYLSLSNNKTAKAPLQTEQTVANNPPVQIQKVIKNEDINVKKITANADEMTNKLAADTQPENITPPQEKPEKSLSNKVKPTNKSQVIKSALLAAGKSDPFSDNTSKPTSPEKFNSFLPPNIGKNSLSPSFKDLPNISSLPNINLPNSNLYPSPYNTSFINPEVKGFIGNKVIISINGTSESLKVNESFQGIKVVKIDPANMTVKFIQDKKVITKNIKSSN